MLKTTTGDRIKSLVKQKGRMQRDLAQFLGLSNATMSQKLSGHIQLYAHEIPKIADWLGVSTDYLFGLTSDHTPPNDS